jgi:glycosyltransferase involved in cell wall biosynthesis
MVDQKRHDLLVEAWARTSPASVLLVAGDGPRRAAIEAAVARHGIADRVRLLGERADVPRLLGASDVLVLPTDWEGLPISLLEAMAVGVPVVVSRVGGVVESLGSAVHLVEPGSADALAVALDALATDVRGRTALGRRGRTLVEHRFAMEPMLARHREIHTQLAGSARAAHKVRSAA